MCISFTLVSIFSNLSHLYKIYIRSICGICINNIAVLYFCCLSLLFLGFNTFWLWCAGYMFLYNVIIDLLAGPLAKVELMCMQACGFEFCCHF